MMKCKKIFGFNLEKLFSIKQFTKLVEKLWIVHGDQFDGVIRHAKWLAYIGDKVAVLINLIIH